MDIHDAILGYDWLESRSPMDYHWKNKTISWQEEDKYIKLQGVVPQQQLQIQELPAKQFLKWTKGNDIWTCAIVEHNNQVSKVDKAVKNIINEFQDLFVIPNQLPPQRAYDHTILLLPNSTLVNSRPYRYSPAHKDETEK